MAAAMVAMVMVGLTVIMVVAVAVEMVGVVVVVAGWGVMTDMASSCDESPAPPGPSAL